MTRTKDRDRQRLRFTTFDDGLTRLTGDLVGVDALEVRQLVEEQADRLFHQLQATTPTAPPDLPMPGRATLLAMALVELVRRGSVVDRDTTDGPAVDVTLVIEANRPTDAATEPDDRPPSATSPSVDGRRVRDPGGAVGPLRAGRDRRRRGGASGGGGDLVVRPDHHRAGRRPARRPVGHGPQDPPGQPRPTPSVDPTRRRLHLPGL